MSRQPSANMLVSTPPQLFTEAALEAAYTWVFKLRKDYSANSDIWDLRRQWSLHKEALLVSLNDGSYQFSPLERYEIEGEFLSLWSSKDMIALKLISLALERSMGDVLSPACYHVKGRGGLKKAVQDTYKALPGYQFVLRSDIKGFYDSIRFDSLLGIIESYDVPRVLLTLIRSACMRTETRGGLFYEYHEKGIPMGSPLSPLLGAIALLPLDQAMQNVKGVFYARYMDDWVVLTASKTALRKVIKLTHQVVQALHLKLHPLKTFIGKLCHGFNFLGYYMDPIKILPSQETIRRFHERASVLYEQPPGMKPSHRASYRTHGRDISVYPVHEAAPTNQTFQESLTALLERASKKPEGTKRIRGYVGKWARWLKLGLSALEEFDTSVQTHLPCLFSCWSHGVPSASC